MELGHPAIQSGVVPLTSAFLMTAVLRLIGGSGWGVRIASCAVGVGLLVSSVLVLGVPAWPVHTGMQKFFYLSLGGLGLGILLDLVVAPSRLVLVSALVWMTTVFAWLAWPQLGAENSRWLLAAVGIVGLTILLRVANRSHPDTSAPIMFLITAASLGGIAFLAGSLSLAELGFALAAAFGGFLLWNWPWPRYPFAAAGLLGGGVAVLGLAFLVLLLTDVSPWALTPLALIFFSDALSRRLPAGKGLIQQGLRPIYLVLLGSIPGALAVAIAWLMEPSDSLYYQ